MITVVSWSDGPALALRLLLPVMLMVTESCSGLYGDQRVVLSRGVRGYVSCPALAEPPTTLIVWRRNGEVRARSIICYS